MDATQERTAGTVPLEGGRLCLDFVNTLDPRGSPRPGELLRDYADLVAWSLHTRLITPQTAAELRDAAALRPDTARDALRRAVALREALHRLLHGARSVGAGDLTLLNDALAPAGSAWRLVHAGGGWRWEGSEQLAGLLRPIAWSAVELLASPDHERVKACGDAACGWLFLDTSRNGTRRWCSMAACGNRAKARRHYRRQRAGAASPEGPAESVAASPDDAPGGP